MLPSNASNRTEWVTMDGVFVDLMEDSFDPTFHSNNANDEDNDDFDFLNGQEFNEDDNYWFSEEQINEYTEIL